MGTRSTSCCPCVRANPCTYDNCPLCGKSENDKQNILCLSSESEFLASVLRLQKQEAWNLLGYGQGRLLEWYFYAKGMFQSHATSQPFLWGLKLLDELAKVLFDVGQLTARCNNSDSLPLITKMEQCLLEPWLSKDLAAYKTQTKKLDARSKGIEAPGIRSLDEGKYCAYHEVRTGFTMIQQVGIFRWDEHSADVYAVQWSDGDRDWDKKRECARLCLALAYLDGVSRFAVSSAQSEPKCNGYLLAEPPEYS